MIRADLIALVIILASLTLGALRGFGKVLKLVTGGTVGKAISLVVCYFLYGVVLDWQFVRDFMAMFITKLSESGNVFFKLLLTVRIDMIAVAVLLFFAIQALRRLVVALIAEIVEIDFFPMKIVNRLGGAALLLAFAAMLSLIGLQICAWVSGVEGTVYQSLVGSRFGLDQLFLNNPVNSIFESVKQMF